MAQLGHSVCLVERARFPRRRLGESLSPGVLPLLASIGAVEGLARGATRVHRVSTSWDRGESERVDPEGQGLLVDRGVFDSALLSVARRAGVRVIQPADVRRAIERPDGYTLELESESGPARLEAALLADASGRASRLGARRRRTGPRTFALHGYWRGRGLPRQPRIEACLSGWCWGVPIPDGTYDTLVFVDEARVRSDRDVDRDEWLTRLLGDTGLWPGLVGAVLDGPARLVDATPYLDEASVAPHRIRVGEAAIALDPLSSSGVQKAIQTALSGAIVANTLLREPGRSELAMRFHAERLAADAERHRAWSEGHYRRAAARFADPFWAARAGDASRGTASQERAEPDPRAGELSEALTALAEDTALRLSSEARISEVPCLGAEYVELRRALEHPGLDGPIAFVAGRELGPLLAGIPPRFTAGDLVRRWSPELPAEAGRSIVRWLAARGVLVPG